MSRYFKILILMLSFLAGFPGRIKAEEILAWQDCIREAQQNHPDLISSQEDIAQSEASKKITASALFPQLSSDASLKTTATSGTTTEAYSFGASATQLIFDGFKTASNLKAASENLKAARHQYRYTSSQVRYRLRSAFIDLWRAQELIRVTEDIVKLRKNNLVVITLSYESGLEHKGALLTGQANLAQAEFEYAQARRNLEVAQRQLIKEMGRSAFASVRVREDFSIDERHLQKPDFEALAQNNPYLEQLISQENVAALEVNATYANFYPQISAQAGVGKKSSQWPPEDNQWSTGLTFTLPLFEGGLRIAQVQKAKAALRQAQAKRRSAGDGIVVTLQETWADLQDAVEIVDVRQKSLAAAQARSKIAEAQYSVGLISYDNWSIIEDNLVQAQKAYLDAQANVLLAQAGWIQAKGETLEYAL